MSVQVLDERESDEYLVRLLAYKEDTLDGRGSDIELAPFSVELVFRDDGDWTSEEEAFPDEPSARNHFRTVCKRVLGINVPYQAPAFTLPAQNPDVPFNSTDVYFHYHSRLAQMKVGDPAATVVRDEMIANPIFEQFADEIHSLATSNDWVGATIRVACKRIMAKQEVTLKAKAEQTYADNPLYGMF